MPKIWTKAQTDAMDAKGSVIVTAAAGSGKTAVLVERVIKRLCDENNPISADRILIVTFTIYRVKLDSLLLFVLFITVIIIQKTIG